MTKPKQTLITIAICAVIALVIVLWVATGAK